MASTHLTRTVGNIDQQKFTWSVWLKRAKLGAEQHFCGAYTDGNNRTHFFFDSNDCLKVYMNVSSTDEMLITNRKFRDTSAWYHLQASFDTTQSTAADRVKIYVNGVQETSFSTATYFGQNTNLAIRGVHWIGDYAGGGLDYDGCMSHLYFIDGTACLPTVFGETDATTGEWKIKTAPTVTMGTEGYTILKDGNTITDQSSNSNDFTLGSGNVTNTEDNPSNVFATLNSLAGSLSNNTLSNGNTSFQATSGWRWRPSTICPSKGKFYYEVKMTGSTPLYEVVGVVPQVSWKDMDGETIGAGANSEAESVGYNMNGTVLKANSTVYSGTSYTVGDVVCVAVDLDNRAIYFRKNGGSWENSGDPTSGASKTGAASLSTTLDDWSLSTSASGTDAGSSINYGNGYFGTTVISSEGTNASGIGKFEYDVPTGYTALSTKGLNE